MLKAWCGTHSCPSLLPATSFIPPPVPYSKDVAADVCPSRSLTAAQCLARPPPFKVRMLLQTCAHHDLDHLVLGAWGCGAFKNPAPAVAELFREQLYGEFRGCFQHVTFAILERGSYGAGLNACFKAAFPGAFIAAAAPPPLAAPPHSSNPGRTHLPASQAHGAPGGGSGAVGLHLSSISGAAGPRPVSSSASAGPTVSFDHAYGCLLGAAVGDAAGAFLEFRPGFDSEDVRLAMTMPGGGVFKVGPGELFRWGR